MNRLQEIYDITRQLSAELETPVKPKARAAVISRITALIEQREIHMDGVRPPYTEEEKQIGKSIVHLNASIQTQMQRLFAELKLEMKQVKQQKKSNRTYTNPYENIAAKDGMFLDHKK
jgi:flagellar protein FliT